MRHPILPRLFLLSLHLAAATTGCAPATDPAGPADHLAALPRRLSAAEVSVRDASNDFAFSLFRRTSSVQPGQNVFISPLSVSMSLGMVLNGARSETRRQMQQVLGFDDAELATIQDGYRDLTTLLRGLDPSTSFRIANSIWYRQGLTVVPAFLDAGRTYFDAEVAAVDFTDAEGTKRRVNDWVRTQTNGRIPTIIDSVSDEDVMYLVNAIWFKGSWRQRFDPAATRDATFMTTDGATQPVRMMSQRTDSLAGFRAYADTQLLAGELPYGNGAFAMTILMPSVGTDVDALAAKLTPARWNAIVSSLSERRGWDLELPRFTLEYERELADDLQALGMTDVFDEALADLSALSPERPFLGFVKHKTFVRVDEEGTEAAAVTNSGIMLTSLPPGFRVDRPFLFVLRERLSGTILFLGKVTRIP